MESSGQLLERLRYYHKAAKAANSKIPSPKIQTSSKSQFSVLSQDSRAVIVKWCGRLARQRCWWDVDFKSEFTSMILRHRGYLPHLESPNSIYFVTFRLAGSIPSSVLTNWRLERENMIKDAERQKRELSGYEKEKLKYLFSSKIERYLDRHYGECWLERPTIAHTVVQALKHLDGTRYHLHAWCIMPNHVHVVFTAISRGMKLDSDLIPILQSWKSVTAHKANKILNRTGPFWQGEYYDHLIRSDEEYAHYINYTLQNPVKANLCSNWEQWSWNGCSEEIRRLMTE